MPLYPYGRTPGKTPSGRNVKYSANEARAAEILADFNQYGGPSGKYSQSELNWAKSVLPDTAPVVQNKRLASPPGVNNPLDALMLGASRFGAPRQSIFDSFNNKYGTNIGAQDLGFSGPNTNPVFSFKNWTPPTTPTNFVSLETFNNPQAQSDILSHNLMTQPQVTNPDAIASLFRNQYGSELPAGSLTVQNGAGVTPWTPPALQVGGASNLDVKAAGTVASFDQQWNDVNDPGGFIRKFQSQQANNPWVPSWGAPGLVYGKSKTYGM